MRAATFFSCASLDSTQRNIDITAPQLGIKAYQHTAHNQRLWSKARTWKTLFSAQHLQTLLLSNSVVVRLYASLGRLPRTEWQLKLHRVSLCPPSKPTQFTNISLTQNTKATVKNRRKQRWQHVSRLFVGRHTSHCEEYCIFHLTWLECSSPTCPRSTPSDKTRDASSLLSCSWQTTDG